MSIFSTILSKIFPSSHPANKAGGAMAGTQGAAPGAASPAAATPPVAPTVGAQPAGAGAATQPVDVEAILTEKQSKNSEKLNWRTSIVDLLKLLGLDSSITARKALASELGYTGSTDDPAAMNIWLHKQVMKKLAENGGKLPADLLD